jgi:hypothetical protein
MRILRMLDVFAIVLAHPAQIHQLIDHTRMPIEHQNRARIIKADLVESNHEQSKRLIAEVIESFDLVFDRIQAKLDQFATLGMRRPDQSSPARNQGQGGAAGQSEAGICSPK